MTDEIRERFTITLHEPGDRFEPPLPGAAYLSTAAVAPPVGWPRHSLTDERSPCLAVTWVQSVSAQNRAAAAAAPPKPFEPLPPLELAIAKDEHEKFDSLMAQYLGSNPGRTPSKTTLADVMHWSASRLEASSAVPAFTCCVCGKGLEPSETIVPHDGVPSPGGPFCKPCFDGARSAIGHIRSGIDSRGPLKCEEHISKGLFKVCEHWELATGETLELRWKPNYSRHDFALILWEGGNGSPGLRVGESFEADSVLQALSSLRGVLTDKLTASTDLDERARLVMTVLGLMHVSDAVSEFGLTLAVDRDPLLTGSAAVPHV